MEEKAAKRIPEIFRGSPSSVQLSSDQGTYVRKLHKARGTITQKD